MSEPKPWPRLMARLVDSLVFGGLSLVLLLSLLFALSPKTYVSTLGLLETYQLF